MKKIYTTPAIKIAVVRFETILAGSSISVYNAYAGENASVLSKRGFDDWDDEEDY